MKRQKTFKKKLQPRVLQALIASVGIGLLGLSLLFVSFAATPTAKLYVSPASQSLNLNGSFTIDVRIQTDKQMNYVRSYLSFPAAKLQVTALSTTGTDFATSNEQTYDNAAGLVKISRSSSTQKTGSLLVAHVTFQAKQNGSAAVAFTSDSKLNSGGAYGAFYPNQLTTTTGGTYTITTPPPPPPPPVADTTAPKKPAKPVIGTVTASSIAISWPANASTDGVVKYRLYRGSTFVKDVTTTSATDTGLQPSTSYSYTITAWDAANNQSTASDAASAKTSAANTPAAPATPTTPPTTADASTSTSLASDTDTAPSAPNTANGDDSPSATGASNHNRITAILVGGGVLLGLGAIGTALLLSKRRTKLTLPPQHDLTPEQVEAEMNSSLLPRDPTAEPMPELNEQTLVPPASADIPAPPYQSFAEPFPPEPEAVPPVPMPAAPPPPVQAAALPTPEPPQPDTAATNLKEIEEPKDMFDMAEEQFHYNEKFQKPAK